MKMSRMSPEIQQGKRFSSAGIPGAILALGLLATAAIGCRVEDHMQGNHDDVKIATPFGGMSVKTDDSAVQAGVGMSVYPGATLIKKTKTERDGKQHDEGAADINMSFGSFHLGVKALSYETSDAPEKVLAFYRKDMARYGAVVFCQGSHAVGTPTETQDGLGCEDKGASKNNIHVNNDGDGSYGELKAGSKLHQHIVSLDAQGAGTKIGLVALDLPGHMNLGDDSKE
jgi:hypothetical protein